MINCNDIKSRRMSNLKHAGVDPIGAVICFVIYVILCGQIITLIESQWLIIPKGLQNTVSIISSEGEVIEVRCTFLYILL